MLNIKKEALSILTNHSLNLDLFGELLNDQWKIKRSLTNKISNKDIDLIYELGIDSGAIGGKLLGAGGGGFMLFYVPKKFQNKVKKNLGDKLYVPFRFDFTGSKIVYYSHQEN